MNIQTEHIIDYLEGKLSPKTKNVFEKQMQDSPELQKEVDDLRFICDTSRMLYAQEQIDVNKHWHQVSKRLQQKHLHRKVIRFLHYAAAILILPALICSIYFYRQASHWKHQPIEQVELSNAYGLISKVTLPDGSEVWLNSGSKLHYPQRFTGTIRKVYLSGEAYFKVTADPEHRFDVTLPTGLTVSAYGTEFNINAYEDDNKQETTLAEGAVEIRCNPNAESLILTPGKQAIYNKETGDLNTKDANLYMVTSWKDGKMVFRRTEMEEIAQRLSHHFNANIILKDPELFSYKYSATFTTETLEEVLRLLEKTAPIRCTLIEPQQINDYAYTRRSVIIEAR